VRMRVRVDMGLSLSLEGVSAGLHGVSPGDARERANVA
jgi:hypothetical protein